MKKILSQILVHLLIFHRSKEKTHRYFMRPPTLFFLRPSIRLYSYKDQSELLLPAIVFEFKVLEMRPNVSHLLDIVLSSTRYTLRRRYGDAGHQKERFPSQWRWLSQ